MKVIRVLILEDTPSDAELIEHALTEYGLGVKSVVVCSRTGFEAAIKDPVDVVLADYSTPSFGAIEALALCKTAARDVPLIAVSGTFMPERAAACLRGGATDFILKDRLAGLGAAVLRAIGEAEARRARKRLEEQLQQAQKTEIMGRLAGGVAHDFNNSLTAILGFGEMILGQADPASPIYASAIEIKKAAERAARLTRQLLAFSRRQIVRPEILDLNSVVGSMEPMIRRLIGEDIALTCSFGDPLGRVEADRGQIEQVVLNLVVNARDAMQCGGRLSIETRNDPKSDDCVACPRGGAVLLAVSDTGHGMDEEVKKRLFEPFFTTKEPGKGTGLGMSIVLAVVERARGHIHIDSSVGRGTAVVIRLPKTDRSASVRIAASAKTSELSGQKTVLVAEDDPAVRMLVLMVLRRAGYLVLEASDGEAAVETARTHSGTIDMFLTDSVMPNMGGAEAAVHLRRIRPSIRILMMSGFVDRGDPQAQAEPDAVIAKPFSQEQLLAALRECLSA